MRRSSGTHIAQGAPPILLVGARARVDSYRPHLVSRLSVDSLADGRALAHGSRWLGVIVEVLKSDDTRAVEVIDALRALDPDLPVLIVGPILPTILTFSCPHPVSSEVLVAFEAYAIRRAGTFEQRVEVVLRDWVTRVRITPTEAKMLSLGAHGLDRRAIASTLEHTLSTFESHTKSLLRKLRADSFAHAVVLLLIEANGGERVVRDATM